MTNHIHFYDAATPENVPSGVCAAVYVNGFAWPDSQVDRMSRVFRVSVDRDPSWARHARCLDIEQGAGEPPDMIPFLHERLRAGHHDATAYVNRSNILDVHERVMHERERIADDRFTCRYWLATLDGSIPAAYAGLRLWAVQYQGGFHAAFDLSMLLGTDDLVKP